MPQRERVFISYSHKDAVWLKQVREHLDVFEREGLIDVFEDTRIGAGEDWYARLHQEMLRAKLAVLLVSAPFLSSTFIGDEEIPRLFDKHTEGGMKIYPILVRPCPWKRVKWLASLQMRPPGAKAISQLRRPAREQVLTDIVDEIALLVGPPGRAYPGFEKRRGQDIRGPRSSRFKQLLPGAPESSGPFDEHVFKWMDLSEGARRKLGQSKFIKFGGTRDDLMRLVGSAKRNSNYSILAICGNKGNYSEKYYRENFRNCKVVKRIFSYEAIHNEIKKKKKRNALNGLNMHLDGKATTGKDVEVVFIPKGVRIKHLGDRTFNPPLSFGLAILRDGNDSPKKAIVHWETDAEALKHLIDIEGVIIDHGQKELLKKLVELHDSIAGSDEVLSSKNHLSQIKKARNELEEYAKLKLPEPGEKGNV
ncbi:MAG TPA: toll/interleukin-1 receptor domain-containing protein [Blastocatellia bacterium]|nr:toll/interleukin-1 receptor domain-containing protein [Blastocatellia bacterium]